LKVGAARRWQKSLLLPKKMYECLVITSRDCLVCHVWYTLLVVKRAFSAISNKNIEPSSEKEC